MKKVLLFSLFFTTIVYSQQDTIQIKEHDITYIHKEYPNEQENVLHFKHGTYYYALCIRLKEKYSIILKMMPQDIRNYPLYTYIDAWIGTPYKPQSLDKKTGVDASYFVQALFSDVYKETFPKTADGIFRSKSLQLFTGRDFLKEGDILFFRYSKEQPISDVGIYLHNDRILACTEEGLNIYDFNDPYFQLRYVAAGRLKQEQKK